MTEGNDCLHCRIIEAIEGFTQDHSFPNEDVFIPFALRSLANVVVNIVAQTDDIKKQAELMGGFLSCVNEAIQQAQKPPPGQYMH